MEQFDIEKWRNESPMDYTKAFEILTQCSEDEIGKAFWSIVKIAQLHIPDTLWKFYSLTDNAALNSSKLETLRRCEIYLSEVKALNDPFDAKTLYYNSERLRKFPQLEHCNGKLFDDLSSYSRVSCLTASGVDNLSMWANYSNNHNGYCVSYDMAQSNKTLKSLTFPVQYTGERYDWTDHLEIQVEKIISRIESHNPANGKAIVIKEISLILLPLLAVNMKGTDWEHEREFRCSIGNTQTIKPFVSAIPKELFVGMNCSKDHFEALANIGHELNIPTYRMKFNDTTEKYTLMYEEITHD